MRAGAAICGVFLVWAWTAVAGAAEFSAGPLPSIDVPFASETPALNAGENDPAWIKGAEIRELVPSVGIKAGVPFQKTTVRLLWDKSFLYVRFVCEDDDIFATLQGRDAEYSREDVVEVFLDPVGDEREFIELQLSPNNGVRDVLYLCTGEPQSEKDRTQPGDLIARDVWTFPEWTCEGLKTAANRFEGKSRFHGWIAELAIPANCLRRLGLKEFKPMTLRANFVRLDSPKDPVRPGARLFMSSSWSSIIAGRAHRSPAANGYLTLKDR